MPRLLKIFFRIVLLLIIAIIVLSLSIKWTGKMDYRKSNIELQALLQKEDNNVTFLQHKISDQRTLSYVQVVEKNVEKDVALVMVHGSPGALDAYNTYLSDAKLYKIANLYSVDRPGFGFSNFGQPEPILQQQSDAIADLISSFSEETVILVGHSFGGAVIAKIAMDYSEMIDGMVSIAGTISPEAEPANWWRKIINLAPIRACLPTPLTTCNTEMLPLKSELRKMKDDWRTLDLPVTILHGDADWIVDFDNLLHTKDRMAGMDNVKYVKMEGEGHLIIWTMPDRMKDEIIKLMQRVTKDVSMAR